MIQFVLNFIKTVYSMFVHSLSGARSALPRLRSLTQQREVATEPVKYLIVGLGNPGARYQYTRHNIGFEVIDALAEANGIQWMKKLSHKAQVAHGRIQGVPVMLCKPMTFMNVSGESVAPLMKKHGLEHSQVLVIFDDLDSDFGAIKLKKKGGHGGHNGMRSIIQHLGNSQEFPRVKVGIGRPLGQATVVSHVLGRFEKDQQEQLKVVIEDSVCVVQSICELGLEITLSGKRI